MFGAAFQLGIAAGLGVGSLLADAGVDWRAGFVISAAAGLSALPLLPAHGPEISLERRGSGFVRLAIRSSE